MLIIGNFVGFSPVLAMSDVSWENSGSALEIRYSLEEQKAQHSHWL